MATVQELAAEMAELKARAATVEAEITAAQSLQKAGVIAEIKAKMAESGVKLADLAAPRARRQRSGDGATAPHPQKGTKVPAKYVSQAGDTWSGRGLQPRWLRDAVAAGATPESFRVPA